MTLDQFEALVQSQTPAAVPWEPVTDYSFEARKAIEGQHPRLIKDVFQPRLVIDVGCGPDAHLVRLLREIGVHALGFDVQKTQSVDVAFDIGSRLHEVLPQADLVTYREVNEHLTLRQMRWAVSNLCALSSRWVYGTTRFSSENDIFRVDTCDNLDPTHISLVSKSFLKLLFALEGFRYRADLTDAMDWKRYGRTFVFERG